jgi:glycosyltransferase involved in cell wall biosynthesis
VSARRIIVPSGYVAGDVSRILGVDPSRIDVIPMGAAVPELPEAPAQFAGPYILHAGGFDARKNLPALLRAFALAVLQMGGDWRLILLGAPHTANPVVYPPIQPEIERLGLDSRVILTGRVSEREKHALFHYAAIAVAPSLSEGFGLPILEAMAHGVPVVASNRTSHPEVAGDAAILVEPTENAIAAALVQLANDSELRNDLSQRGRARAERFTWARTAQLTAETYHNALDELN